MKIAILSMHRIINYGSVLQAYSLRKMIEEITGVKAEFIDIENDQLISVNMPIADDVDYAGKKKHRPRTFINRIKGKIANYIRVHSYEPGLKKFMEQVLEANSNNNNKHYDVVVVGSDEMFKSIDTLNLQTYGNIRQADRAITYAASCGSAVLEGIPLEKRPLVKQALSNYQAISVRDKGTERYIRSLYDGSIYTHLDPVLMWDLYKKEHRPVFLKNYLVVYAYGDRIKTEEEIDTIVSFAKKHGLKTLAIGGMQWWCDYYLPMDPFRMLDYFYYAKYIVTDTFHGLIFSVINQKKMAVILRKTNRNKLSNLVHQLGLDNRIVSDMSELEEKLIAEIDYQTINCYLEAERVKAKDYLKQYLLEEKEKN